MKKLLISLLLFLLSFNISFAEELPVCNKYTEEMLCDGNFNTAWCEGAEGDGIGEWIEFHLKRKA